MFGLQNTVRNRVDFSDIGLHSGCKVSCSIIPSEVNTGIVFKRIDVENNNKNTIIASYKNVTSRFFSTNISNNYGLSILTIEHLMAALWGCKIDNCIIEINAEEVPIMDGSSEPFVFLIECAGIKPQNEMRNVIEILKTVIVYEEEGNKNSPYIQIDPSNNFSVEIEIDFDNKFISRQKKSFNYSDMSFKNDISRARTFTLEKDIEYMLSNGLGKGGSLDNAIVVSNDNILNKEKLRYKDEFVRHKILDCIGDMYLAGKYIKGAIKGFKSGHSLNNKLLNSLFSENSFWREIKG